MPTKYLYEKSDVINFKEILHKCESISHWNPIISDKLHTVFPELHINPGELITKVNNYPYGIRRMNLSEFLLRPNMCNVRSCHKIIYDSSLNAGNLNYIANPNWSCYGVFSDKKQPLAVRLGDEYSELQYLDDVVYDNYIATINAAYGCIEGYLPAVMLTRIYGKRDIVNILPLINYFQSELKMHVVFQTSKILESYVEPFLNTATKYTFTTMPAIPQITFNHPLKEGEKAIAYRYPDIENAYMTEKGELVEKHPCYVFHTLNPNAGLCTDDLQDKPKVMAEFPMVRLWFGAQYHMCGNCYGMSDQETGYNSRGYIGDKYFEYLCEKCYKKVTQQL